MRRMLMLAGIGVSLAGAADPAYQSARRKIDMIAQDRAGPGSKVWLSAAELNAYARVTALETVPKGLRNPSLELGSGSAVGSALIDFSLVRQSKDAAPNPLVAWLLSGERPVRAAASIESGGGRATVHLRRVTVGSVTVQGGVLDFLIEHFLLPRYPDAKIGTPFELRHNMERFEISPKGVNVVIAPRK